MRLRYPAKPTLNLPANAGRTSMSGVLARGPQGLPGTPNIAWAASTVYALDQVVMAPDGSIIKCTLAHTSAATFDATEAGKWKAVGAVSGTKAYTDLGATYARFEKTDGTPVTGKAVTIIVNDLDEIEDIITEDI